MNKFLCIYDFDSNLYGSSTVLHNAYIEVEHIKSKRKKEFKNITEFKGRSTVKVGGWLGELNKEKGTNFTTDDFIITNHQRRNSVPFDKAKEYLISSIESVRSKEWCKELKLVIGSDNNFRYKIDPDYKANRPPKPLMFKKLKEWFIEEYKDDIIISDGCEADDVLSIYGWWGYNKSIKSGDYNDNDICLIHIDKDIDQVPGWHWNNKSKKEKPEWITEIQAMKNLCVQLLQGDVTDNIKGLEGIPLDIWNEYSFRGKKLCIGKLNALKLLSDCESKDELINKTLFLYKSYFCDIFEEEFNKQYSLIKLQEKKGVIPKWRFQKK